MTKHHLAFGVIERVLHHSVRALKTVFTNLVALIEIITRSSIPGFTLHTHTNLRNLPTHTHTHRTTV